MQTTRKVNHDNTELFMVELTRDIGGSSKREKHRELRQELKLCSTVFRASIDHNPSKYLARLSLPKRGGKDLITDKRRVKVLPIFTGHTAYTKPDNRCLLSSPLSSGNCGSKEISRL
jgi:hypothetical protein